MEGIRVMQGLTVYCNLFRLTELDRLRNPTTFFFEVEKWRQVFLERNSLHFQRMFIKSLFLWP